MTCKSNPESSTALHKSGLSWRLFLASCRIYCRIWKASFFPPKSCPSPGFRRCLILLVFLPLFGVIQLIHWLFLALDRLLFPEFMKINIEKPLFIMGVPRSGTTHLHRVMAMDTGRFTVFRLWHVLFAPSICQRKIIKFAGKLDRLTGRPCKKLVDFTAKVLTRDLKDIHHLSLDQPEEDFILLMPVMACFILIPAFPQARDIYDLAFFDHRFSRRHRMDIMNFYKSMLKRHLYCEGRNATLLSKNVSFTPMLSSLEETFPDAGIVACVRNPARTLASQASSMEKSWKLFGNNADSVFFTQLWKELMDHYYQVLAEAVSGTGHARMQCVDMSALTADLSGTVLRIYEKLDMIPDESFIKALKREHDRASSYSSSHRYDLAEYGFDPEDIQQTTCRLWKRIKESPICLSRDTRKGHDVL
ncbi:MAG: sulfotransferase [Desulfonatronovibrio sp.]